MLSFSIALYNENKVLLAVALTLCASLHCLLQACSAAGLFGSESEPIRAQGGIHVLIVKAPNLQWQNLDQAKASHPLSNRKTGAK